MLWDYKFSIGFSGTRDNINEKQKNALRNVLNYYNATEFHHGDCVGADSEFHDIVAQLLGAKIIIHPPINNVLRAFKNSDNIMIEKDYLQRNRDIVDVSDLIIAIPKELREQKKSGTWATIRYARKIKVPVIMIAAGGEVLFHDRCLDKIVPWSPDSLY